MLSGLTSVALAGALAAATLSTSTVDLLAASDAPEGYELVDESAEMTYDEFSEASPYSVAHVDPASDAAATLRAGQDVWTAADAATLLRDVVVWHDEASADRYIDDVVAYAGGEDLTEVEPPFDGARAFAGRDDARDVSVRLVAWRHGMIGAAISHFHLGADPGADTIRATSVAFADGITATSGFTITVTPPDEEPEVVPDSTAPHTDPDARSGGGIPIGRVLLWLLIGGTAVWLFVRIRRRLREASEARAADVRRDRSVDEIIDAARARRELDDDGSAARPSDPTGNQANERSTDRSSDDIVAEARRRARRELDEATDADL